VITVIGEALIDLVPARGNSTFRALPGGSPLNIAIGAARLGYPTALMARLSSDPFGQLLRRHIQANGVGLEAAAEADEPTTLAVDTPGMESCSCTRLYLHGTADWQWSTAELGRIPAATSVLHCGSLACCVEPGAGRILRTVARQRRRGALVCLDPNVCPAVLGTPARGRVIVERMVMAADVVKSSYEQMAWLYPGRALEDLAEQWLRLGPGLVIVTCGADGAIALRGARTVLHRPAHPVRVVDTDGAGDAFTAALLGAFYQLRQAGVSLPALSADGLGRVLDMCAVASGLTCARSGADLPTAAELRRALHSGSGTQTEYATALRADA
jgi:fructokinase